MARISPPTATPPGRIDILTAMVLGPDSPLNPDLDLLFARHQAHCHADTPPESIHMMDRSALDIPAISFLALRDGENEQDAERAEIEHQVAPIEDQKLREALENAMRASAEWTKGVQSKKEP